MGYILTEKGEQEADLYKEADEDELRLTRRSLMFPVLEAIREKPYVTFNQLLSGFEGTELGAHSTLSFTIRALYKGSYIDRLPPQEGEDALEWTHWRRHLRGESQASKDSREEDRQRRLTEKSKERYPEVFQASIDKFARKGVAEAMRKYREPKEDAF